MPHKYGKSHSCHIFRSGEKENITESARISDFNKTFIPLALVEYEIFTGSYNPLGAARLVDYLSSCIQRALVEHLLIIPTPKYQSFTPT